MLALDYKQSIGNNIVINHKTNVYQNNPQQVFVTVCKISVMMRDSFCMQYYIKKDCKLYV